MASVSPVGQSWPNRSPAAMIDASRLCVVVGFLPIFSCLTQAIESESIEICRKSVPLRVSDAEFPSADVHQGLDQIMSSACKTATLIPPSRDHASRALALEE